MVCMNINSSRYLAMQWYFLPNAHTHTHAPPQPPTPPPHVHTHSIRPFRFGIAVAMAPVFDQLLDRIQTLLSLKTKRAAFGVYVAALGIVTCVVTFGSIGLFAGPQAFARA